MSDVRTEIRRLRARLRDLEDKIEVARAEIAQQQRECTAMEREAKKLQAELIGLEQSNLIAITDHAIVRFLERVGGINMDDVRAAIDTEQLRSAVAKLGGSGTFPTGNGFRVIMRDGVVVTIEPK